MNCRPCPIAFLAALLLPGSAGNAADFGALRREIKDLGRLTAPPAVYPVERPGDSKGARALFFEGVPYRGKRTRVFAWYGTPRDRARKSPGIVLVQGGGGSAYLEWVRKWNERGFAAISIAVEGQTDERAQPSEKGQLAWKRHQWAGPAREGIYGDTAEPLGDQWMYHAVAATVLANSLLRSFPEVDAARVGLMGISWGGVITSTVAGIDRRFAFAIPTYGCGAMGNVDNQWGRALGGNRVYREAWDPLLWLPHARMPILWLTWLRDEHFPLTAQSASYRAARGPRMVAVLPDMKHSHPAGWTPPDSYAFAEAVARTGKPWLRQTAVGSRGGQAAARFSTDRPIDGAVLYATSDTGFVARRKWTETRALIEQNGSHAKVTATLPPGTTAWFFNLRGAALTASSDFVQP